MGAAIFFYLEYYGNLKNDLVKALGSGIVLTVKG